ncbi:MAG: outer membrane protein assembly factor BamA [Proteobacteria bacterium]|nr:outer membrane protein assembly factor BamA [Pseudomonadota bacterium]
MDMVLKFARSFLIVVMSLIYGVIPALANQKLIARIQVIGNEKIESSAIFNQIETKVGDPLSPSALQEDLKTIYELGYFTDVQVDVKEMEEGPLVTFVVVEKASIGQILISGNEKIETSKIREKIDIRLHSIVKTDKLQEIIENINKLYLSKGYYGSKVSYRIEPLEKNEVVLEITIEEGKKASIRKVIFTGNDHISSRKLRRTMNTKKRGSFGWLTGRGRLDEEILNNDADILRGFYYDQGFLRAKIEKPRVIVGKKGKSITIEVAVDEGAQFSIEKIDFKGDILTTEESLFKVLKTKERDVYRNVVVQNDVLKLTDLYADQGYANVDVNPRVKLDDEKQTVNLTFEITKGEQVYFERINIVGNTKTRDKVVRRELRFGEGDLYTSTGMKRSRQRLRQTGYFKEVDFTTSEGTSAEKLDLEVAVEEAPTGSVSLGVGFSTKDQFVIEGAFSQRNLLGLGYQFNVSGEVGGETSQFKIGFTDPWLLGYPVLAGIDLYATEDEFFDSYSSKVRGGRFRLGKELGEYLRGRITYTYENVEIFDVAATASRTVKEQEGERDSSILGLTLSMDRRDDFFFPTRGGIYRFEAENSGGILGGDNDFYRLVGDFGYYYPLFWKLVGHGRILLGLVEAYSGQEVPIWERFYVGGIRTIRGFEYGEAGPEDEVGEVIGSEKEATGTIEILFPVKEDIGVRGVVFFDVGKGFDDFDDFSPLRTSVGVGLRWLTPLAPLRVDYGFNLNPEDDEESSRFHFFLGGTF